MKRQCGNEVSQMVEKKDNNMETVANHFIKDFTSN